MKYVWVVTWHIQNSPRAFFSSEEAADAAIDAWEDASINLGRAKNKKDLYGACKRGDVFSIEKVEVK